MQSRDTTSGSSKPFVPNPFDTFPMTWRKNHKDWEKTVFNNLFPRKMDWKNRLSGAELDQYLPVNRESVRTRFSDIGSEAGRKSFPSLKLFESINGGCFFVGGPVWSSAWCPTPPDVRHTQFVSIACHRTFEEEHGPAEEYSGRGLIQIWNLSELSVDSEMFTPRFALGIAHEGGCVYDMAWCPAGCAWKPQKSTNDQGEEVMSRLGLLALACSDSTVKIYSVPYPSELTGEDVEEKLIVKATATFILHSKFTGQGESRGCCMAVDWDPNNERTLILAGYGQGYICIFDLCTQSPLLGVHTPLGPTELFPFRSILGHSLKVTSCQWSPSLPGYFVTGSYDKQFSIWNMRDVKHCVIQETCDQLTSIRWIPSWHQPLSAQLEYKMLFNSRLNVLNPLDKSGLYKKVLTNTSLFGPWDMDHSPWLHMVISANNLGHVSGVNLDASCDEHKKKKFKKFSFFLYEAVTEMEDEKTDNKDDILSEEVAIETYQNEEISSSMEQKSSEVEKADVSSKIIGKPKDSSQEIRRFSYEELKDKCYLHFKINNTLQNAYQVVSDERINIQAKAETELPKEKFNRCPLPAIFSVSCSVNASSCSWVVSGGQSGIVRLSNLSGFITEKARDILHTANLVDYGSSQLEF